jgi:hypothetical protein
MSDLKLAMAGRTSASARIPNDGYADAARVGDIAGLEIEVSLHALRSIGANEYRGARDILTLDADPATLTRLALVILEKMGTPALKDREWRLVVHALRELANSEPSATRDDTSIRALADQIEKGLTS